MKRPVDAVLKEHADGLLALPGVVGVAVGKRRGAPCIQVLVAKKTVALRRRIPADLEGYPVVILETGPLRAL